MNSISRKGFGIAAITMMGIFASINAFAGDEEVAGPSLYERLGAEKGITNIANDLLSLHHKNPVLSHYFVDVDDANLTMHVVAFFSAGTGGPANYQGRDMVTTHADIDMTDVEFDAAVADAMIALKSNGVDAESAAEVAAILESLRPAVMGTTES